MDCDYKVGFCVMTYSASDVPAVCLGLISPDRLCVVLTELNSAGLKVDIKLQCVLEDNLQRVTLCSSEGWSCRIVDEISRQSTDYLLQAASLQMCFVPFSATSGHLSCRPINCHHTRTDTAEH